MEMIDVLTKLKEIAESKPELVKDAVENVEKTNPKVDEGKMKDYLHSEAEKLSREEFLKKHGESLRGFYNAINGDEDDEDSIAGEGKMPAGLKAYHDKKKDKEEKKETVKEAIQISTDSPEEASMMMQILKLAGVQPVDAKMIGAEPEHDSHMDTDDAAGSMDMARMRDIVKNPEDEQKEETFANEPEEKVQDVDSLVNKHSGGMNRQKKQFPKSQDGDNAMAVAQEDRITEEELANSLRTQYESFKQAYQEAAKPDYIDLDKDGNKTEPMKKAAKDKEAKEKK
tara:strand:- start:891 stop:1742 length:852 start_codon:yes stop_codon:yes gene_type:complete